METSDDTKRERLSRVARQAGPILTPVALEQALSMSRTQAAKTLSRWTEQGWVKRIKRGHYALVPLGVEPQAQVLTNPWVLVPTLFSEGYVGGWSASEHWDLTEQVFRTICVMTTAPVRRSKQLLQGVEFRVTHIGPALLFGTRVIWEGKTKILVSDPHRTVVDMLSNPALGAGIRHTRDCLRAYARRSDADFEKILDYASRLGNGAIFKRLGFLLEGTLPQEHKLLAECQGRLTQGNAKLDPSLLCPRLVTRWRLWVPAMWVDER